MSFIIKRHEYACYAYICIFTVKPPPSQPPLPPTFTTGVIHTRTLSPPLSRFQNLTFFLHAHPDPAPCHQPYHIADESNTICNICAVHIWTDLIRWHTKYSKIYGFYGFVNYNFQICNIIPVLAALIMTLVQLNIQHRSAEIVKTMAFISPDALQNTSKLEQTQARDRDWLKTRHSSLTLEFHVVYMLCCHQ